MKVHLYGHDLMTPGLRIFSKNNGKLYYVRRSDQFRLLANTKKIEGPSWHNRYWWPLHKTIKWEELKYNQ